MAATHNFVPLLYLCVFKHGYILCFRLVGGSDRSSMTVSVALQDSSLGEARASDLFATAWSGPSYAIPDIVSESEVR